MSSDFNDINSNEDNRKDYLLQLREALKNKDIGNHIQFEDSFLLKCSRCRVFNVEATCELIKHYISAFNKYPESFGGVDYCKRPIEDGLFYVIPERNVTGEIIGVLRGGLWEPSEYTFAQAMFTTVYGYELEFLDETTQIHGVIEIMDLAEYGMKHFLKMGLSEIKMVVEMTEMALPVDIRKVFVVYENKLADIVYSIAKPFLSKEFRERVHFLGHDLTKLHEAVPKELLPAKYGGTSDKCDPKEYFKKLKREEPRVMKLWEPFKTKTD